MHQRERLALVSVRSLCDAADCEDVVGEVDDVIWSVTPKARRASLSHMPEISRGRLGVRLSPDGAAHCMTDEKMRTFKFWQAIHKCVLDVAMEKKRGETVNVLYLGCGPFATLVLPSSAFFQEFPVNGVQVKFHCLDVHQQSVVYAQWLTAQLGVATSFGEWISKDALDLNFDKDLPVALDVVVAEFMERALLLEPQAPVIHKLAPSIGGARLIPERVEVSLAFGVGNSGKFVPAGILAALTKDGIFTPHKFDEKDMCVVGEFKIPDGVQAHACAFLRTGLQLYGSTGLEPATRGVNITTDVSLRCLERGEVPGTFVKVLHRFGADLDTSRLIGPASSDFASPRWPKGMDPNRRAKEYVYHLFVASMSKRKR